MLTALASQFTDYARLMRLEKPIGIYLLLWPTLWALWIAAEGFPDQKVLLVFITGVVLMRSAGCVINDIADRKIDRLVERTKNRPITSGRVSTIEALGLFTALTLTAFLLVLMTNTLTIGLALIAVVLAVTYPFMKRYTYMPQLVLGMAFGMSIPMAFAAQTGDVPAYAWILYVANVLWTLTYDTMYAITDREDDLKIGVKSTAILFGEYDRLILAILQLLTLFSLFMVGQHLHLDSWYYAGLIASALLFIYHQYLIKDRKGDLCFKAFLHNHWVGLVIFLGILLHYGYTP
ncbi:MAG: 4-hydroxybenzoate octaprenyltransferase [Pseudomonadales bacterium]